MSIVADASAVLAVLLEESDADQYFAKLLLAGKVFISPVNWWEVQVRMRSRYGEPGEEAATKWMAELNFLIEPVDLKQAQAASLAYARFRGRPARLNLGDCFAYALATTRNAPLLFKGDDFASTDVRKA